MHVLAERLIIQQLRHLGTYLQQARDEVDEPASGTSARADLDHVNSHPDKRNMVGLRWWAHRSAELNLHAAAEHLRGVRTLLAADELMPLPAMACARAVYEAVVQTCWLVDVEVSTEQRLARWAGRLLHDSQEPANALDSFGDKNVVERERLMTVEGRGLGQKLMARAGFELKAKGGERSDETRNVTYRGEVSQLAPNVQNLVARFTPDQQSLWAIFSGATHSRGWLVAGLEGDATELFTAILAPLIDTGDALVVEIGRYFGLNPRPPVERLHRHRGVLLRRARPSQQPMLGVDGFRAASNLWPLPARPLAKPKSADYDK